MRGHSTYSLQSFITQRPQRREGHVGEDLYEDQSDGNSEDSLYTTANRAITREHSTYSSSSPKKSVVKKDILLPNAV